MQKVPVGVFRLPFSNPRPNRDVEMGASNTNSVPRNKLSDWVPMSSALSWNCLLLHKFLHKSDDFFRLQIHREVPCVADVNFGPGIVSFVCFCACHGKRRIVTSPDHKERRLVILKPMLPLWIGFNVVLVVVKKVQLNVRLAWLVEEIILVDPQIWIVERSIGRGSDVTFFGGFE